MKISILALVLVAGCSSRSQPHDNLAVRQEALTDPAATCDPWFTDVGEHHEHSAVCTTAAKDVVYCRVLLGADLKACQMLVPGPATLAKAQEEQQRAVQERRNPPPPPAQPPHPEAQP